MIYDIGDKVTLSTVVRNDAGTPVNTPTVTIAVTKGDRATLVSPAPTVTNTGSGGVYTAPVTVDMAGLWSYVWTASGTVVATDPGQFTVDPARVYVASIEEFKAHLNRTDVADDAELRTHLAAATEWVESAIGGPISITSYTETHYASEMIVPRRTPLVAVTSITPYLGTALTADAYRVDTDLGVIYLRYGAGYEHTLVYTAGRTVVPERGKLAGLIVAAHLWETQNGFAGRRNSDDLTSTGLGFAVPRRAVELLERLMVGGIA